MNKKNLIKKELKDLPFLKEHFDKSEGYQVPNDYFKVLEKNILEEVKKSTKPNTASRTKLFSLSTVWSKAAAIALLIGGSLFLWQKSIPSTKIATTHLSTEEIYVYITDNIQEFEEDLLLDQVTTEEFIPSMLDEDEKEFFLEELINDPTIELEDIL